MRVSIAGIETTWRGGLCLDTLVSARVVVSDMRSRIGEQIRQRRGELQLTQGEVAALVGISADHYRRIEQGGNTTLSLLEKLGDVLHLKFELDRKEKI